MGIKVAKFGGSSVADGIQLTKTKQIITQDPDRRYIVVSAPGKRYESDNKITDILYLCKTHIEHNLPYDQLFQVVADRFMAVQINLGIKVDLFRYFDEIRENLKQNPSADYIASRGEYLNAVLVAAFLGYDFVDTKDLIKFDAKGKLMMPETDEAIRAELAKHERAVLPGFTVDNGRVTEVKLYPVDLGQKLPRSQRGLPRLTRAREPMLYLAELSKSYGTEISVDEEGVGSIGL